MLMVTRPLVSKKGKGKRGNFKKNGKQVAAPMKKPKARPKPETECLYCKGNAHWKQNYPKYLADKKDGKVKVYLIYMLLMCTLLVFIVTPGYLITFKLLGLVTKTGLAK